MTLCYASKTLGLDLRRYSTPRKLLHLGRSVLKVDTHWVGSVMVSPLLFLFFFSQQIWNFTASFMEHPPRQPHKSTVMAIRGPFYLCKWKQRRRCHAPVLNHHLRITWRKLCFVISGFKGKRSPGVMLADIWSITGGVKAKLRYHSNHDTP